jgi:hypothetical protein
VGFVRFGIVVAAVCLAVFSPGARAQEQRPQSAPKEQMFSGEVTAIDSASLTALRTGSKDSKTFVITEQTKFEGKPHVKSRVTIRYVVTDEGTRALRVIVKAPPVKK